MALRELPTAEQLENENPAVDATAVLAFLSVLVTQAEIARGMDAHFGRYDLSYGRFQVLIFLWRHADRTATPAEIATAIDVTRATVTGLLDGLEKQGFIARTESRDDGRSVNVKLTRQGSALLGRILPDHHARLALVMEGLTRAEKKELTALLAKVREGVAATRRE